MKEIPKPVVYIFHGNDEYAVRLQLKSLIDKMGDPTTAELNITRLDSRSFSMDKFILTAKSMPFLAKRRMVILDNAISLIKEKTAIQRLLGVFSEAQKETAIVILEDTELQKKEPKKKEHWLKQWARKNPILCWEKVLNTPKDVQMVQWIHQRAEAQGGKIQKEAAEQLAELVADDPRQIDLEIAKLLAFANYERPISLPDVESLTMDISQGDVFAMVDSLGQNDGKKAIAMFHKLLDERDPGSLFGMIIRQIRLLIMARELLDDGSNQHRIAQMLNVYPFVARKLMTQASRYDLRVLKGILDRLLGVDIQIKTGGMEAVLAMDTFMAQYSSLD